MRIYNASLGGLDNTSLTELERILQKCIAQAESEVVTYEESCYFFEYYKDMNASIPACSCYGQFLSRGCNKNCPRYISKADVDKIVREAANRKKV